MSCEAHRLLQDHFTTGGTMYHFETLSNGRILVRRHGKSWASFDCPLAALGTIEYTANDAVAKAGRLRSEADAATAEYEALHELAVSLRKLTDQP